MDHANAHLMEISIHTMISTLISSDFAQEEKEQAIKKSEHLMHNKEQQSTTKYYDQLKVIIQQYNDVLLFGPTNANVELYNLIKQDHHFDQIHIKVEHADKMTIKQEHAYVTDYFSRR